MRIFYDAEFLESGPGEPVRLISIGMVREDGAEYYAVSDEVTKRRLRRRIRRHDWLMANVVPSLPKPSGDANLYMPDRWLFNYSDPCVKPRRVIAREIRSFVLEHVSPELWADYAAYDHVVMCQMFGRMADLPAGFPMWTHDLRQLAESMGIDGNDLPPMPVTSNRFQPHNALHDALEVKYRYDWLVAA